MKKFINIIKIKMPFGLSDYNACPVLHDSKEEAEVALNKILHNSSMPHLVFITQPIEVEIPDDRRPEETSR